MNTRRCPHAVWFLALAVLALAGSSRADGYRTSLGTGDDVLPVVVVSGMQGHKVEFDKLPPPRIRHVSKPFGVDELLSKIRETLDDRFLFPA